MKKRSDNPLARQRILEAARRLMLQKGFGATSLDDICKKVKLTKGCLFHYFRNKEELAQAVLEEFCGCVQEKIDQECCPIKEPDPLKRVYRHVGCLIQMAKGEDLSSGCLLGQFAQELSDANSPLRKLCCEGFDHWAKKFEKDLKEAKEKYIPKSDLNPKSMARYFIAVVEGSMMMAKLDRQSKVFVMNMEYFKKYVESFFKEKYNQKQ